MMDLSHEVASYTHSDNQSVLSNNTITDSASKKKSSSLAYHLIREGVAMDNWSIGCVNSHDN